VQSFIAQARKTQDLYAGSRILSELIKAGIEKFETNFKVFEPQTIFPVIDDKDKLASLPNRFIRQISIPDDIQEVDKFLRQNAQTIKERVQGRLEELASESLNRTPRPTGFNEQLAQALDMHWAFQEIENEDYATAYKKLEQLGGSIKNVRMFEQYTYQNGVEHGEKGRKCNLDGENNALFYKPKQSQAPAYIYGGSPVRGFALQEGEGLSAMSFVKRFFPDTNTFPSTAEVALMKDEAKLSDKQDIQNILKCFKKLFNKERLPQTCIELFTQDLISRINLIDYENNDDWNEHFDYQYCFEENITKKNFPDALQFSLVQKLQNRLQSHLKTNHYALILFDGDSMGKWLAGDKLKPEYREGKKLKEFHTRFSKLLAEFGKHAREDILNPNLNNGQTIYAGGDDFLGFVNLHHLFEVIQKLRTDFDKLVNNGLGTYKQTGKHLTFSAGIVIAHYKTPLSEVLKKAREVEKKAKNQGDRNAFAIAVLKHSGEIQECVFKWDSKAEEASAFSNWQDLETIFTMLRDETFSNKFISSLSTELYDLAGLALDKIDTATNLSAQIEAGVELEIKRLIKRALVKRETPETNKKNTDSLCKAVLAIWQNADLKNVKKTENFIHALHIVDFIHRKIGKENANKN
jgi:CRISPR-associated protein Cmr2